MPKRKQPSKAVAVTAQPPVQQGGKLWIDRVLEWQFHDHSKKEGGELVSLGSELRRYLTKLFWFSFIVLLISGYYIGDQIWKQSEWYFVHTLMRQLFNMSIIVLVSLYLINLAYKQRYEIAREWGTLAQRLNNRHGQESPVTAATPAEKTTYPLVDILPDAPTTQNYDRSGEAYAAQVSVAFRRVGLIDDEAQRIEVLDVEDGPTAAKITISLPTGMRLSKVDAAAKDLQAAFGAPSLQVSGGGRVNSAALIISHKKRQVVTLRSLLSKPEFIDLAGKGGVPIVVGVDAVGNPVLTDLVDISHLLVAGATKSGKSVWLSQEIISLMACRGPDTLRMVLIDPKKVELTPFGGIPHLVCSVVTEEQEILEALGNVCNEMDARYKLFQQVGVRNIGRYNTKSHDKIPYLITVFDEMADVMLSAGKELAPIVQRIVQLGRAAGVHLILATQRPSVDVIPGVIKANLPSRIVFRLVTQADYSTALDRDPGVTLLGKGDGMALIEGHPDLIRIQSACVSPPGSDEEADLERILQAVQRQYAGVEPARLVIRDAFGLAPKPGPGPEPGDDDHLLLNRFRTMVARMVVDDDAETLPSLSVLAQALCIRKQAAIELAQALVSEGWLSPQGERKPYRITLSPEDALAWLDGGDQADQAELPEPPDPFHAPENTFEAPDDFSLF
jgi:hypothetical protein